MRFPWLQVDADFREAKAGDLGALLDISRREAVGLMVDLWAWVLTRSPDDRPPDGIISGTGAVPMLERAAEWTGERGKLAAALEELQLLERLPNGIRLRGVGRYATTWKKNRGGTGLAAGTTTGPARNRSGKAPRPDNKTQTYTQKKEEDPPNPPGGEGAGKAAVLTPRENEPSRSETPVQPEPLSFGPGPEIHGRSSTAAWTIPDAVRAVHREVQEGRDYAWDLVQDERAATALMSLCSAEGLPPAAWPAEIARRFGRALVRSMWKFERREGKAVTLRELARRECWAINADPPSRMEKVRDGYSAVVSEKSVTYDPWAWVLAKRAAA